MPISYIKQNNGPVLGYSQESGVTILERDGLFFKNLSRSGQLLPYEDWRLSAEERAEDLLSRLSLTQLAGLMLHKLLIGQAKLEYSSELEVSFIHAYANMGIGAETDVDTVCENGNQIQAVMEKLAFGIPAMPVDTHVGRVSQRIGFANCENPAIIEKELCAIIPEDKWNDAHHWLIWHGRRVCKARKPLCDSCVIKAYCPSCGKTE